MAAVVVPGPPGLHHPDHPLSLYHTIDPLLANGPVLVFYGPAATIGATSSRIQVHIFTPAGIASYARLAVSPNSPYYTAVSNLPREEQGDEVCRGVAFSLKKLFTELPDTVRKAWCGQAKAPSPSALFGDDHVAILATRLARIDNVESVSLVLSQAFAEHRQSWQDVDIVLPPGAIKERSVDADEELGEDELLRLRYGRYTDLIASLGDTAFLPTSRVKRAPSKASKLGRHASFLKHQKENSRKELRELLDTEESYVERVKELQHISANPNPDLKGSAQDQLRAVFPASIASILDVNADFCTALRTIIEDTEDVSMHDIDCTSETRISAAPLKEDLQADSHGLVEVAKCLCEWLPKFAEPYGQYLGQHADSTKLLRSLFRGSDTALAAELHEVGEQRLTSLLIEPVQRLPRYNLYIDGIVKQLPVRHPAVKHYLKARDLVSEICSQNDDASASSKVEERLRARVSEWPQNASITGRLVTAVDFSDLQPPFTLDGQDSQPGVLLLFTDSIIMLHKSIKTAITARVLLTELESGLPVHRTDRATTPSLDLHFARRMPLDEIDCTEGNSGQVLHLLTRSELSSALSVQDPAIEVSLALKLEGMYEGKAAKFTEELAKARVEGRFSEPERDCGKWEVRASNPVADHSSLLSAVFDCSNPDFVQARIGHASIRVIVDIDRHSQKPRAGEGGIRTLFAVSPLRDGLWRLTIESLDAPAIREHILAADLAIVLSKRIAAVQTARLAVDHPAMTICRLAHNTAILQLLDLEVHPMDETEDAKPVVAERIKRPRSPVKLLSNFLSSTGPGGQLHPIHKNLPALPPPRETLSFSSSNGTGSKPSSREGRPGSRDQALPLSRQRPVDAPAKVGPTRKLEDTLSTYMLALQARKGNIVGRSLKMRAAADELMVNELYNSLLEGPGMMGLAAQASVDVLFAAFEKFLNIAWTEEIGRILPLEILQGIQKQATTLFPTDFDDFFRQEIASLSGPNQRAFKGIMKLLADLLDGTGNDGDRGMLTAAFAEVLITEGNPQDFIPLLDRFVDDTDTYFGEPMDETTKSSEEMGFGHKRTRSLNSSSITSNTSSFRRKFGFSTLGRSNSKSEEESKMSAVWRSFGKSTRAGDASPSGSITKGSLHRSYSIEDSHSVSKRPSSKDGPPAVKNEAVSANQSISLAPIGEHPSFIPTGPPRKKRRSSLSDLPPLTASQNASPFQSPVGARRPQLSTRGSADQSLLPSPIPTTPLTNSASRVSSPTRGSPRSRLPASFRWDASPGPLQGLTSPTSKNDRKSGEVVITARPISGIPALTPRTVLQRSSVLETPRAGLAERHDSGNIVKKPSSSPAKSVRPKTPGTTENASPRKLNMQSPQKLRERLQNEQTAIATAHTSLQDELSKIGNELSATPPRPLHVRERKTIGASRSSQGGVGSMELAQRVLKMEGALPKATEELNQRLEDMRGDLVSSLSVSENKCKKLDELYREANGENEALYAKFNEELDRILNVVRGGQGVEELKKQLAARQEETAKLRRETTRLKRENAGLRAQLRE